MRRREFSRKVAFSKRNFPREFHYFRGPWGSRGKLCVWKKTQRSSRIPFFIFFSLFEIESTPSSFLLCAWKNGLMDTPTISPRARPPGLVCSFRRLAVGPQPAVHGPGVRAAKNGARPRRALGGSGRRSRLRGYPDRTQPAEARLPGAKESRLIPEAAPGEK